ncbi:MAG: branched-chain amino acid aminotransferase [Acidiferrobacterales bacterium]|nr:branched-chain amino acid aminotransferase [Acidiferrobacterales bacterium]
MEIHRTTQSRINEVDFAKITFGSLFSDHMFAMEYVDGKWRNHRIEPFGPIEVNPVSASLHYGQAIFEGMKAYRGVDGEIRIFRPEMNYRRLSASCERMCMPLVDQDTFINSIKELIRVDHRWVPPGEKQALYIRPIMFADEPQLDVRPADRYRYLVILSPVGGYFGSDFPAVSLKAEEKYTRAIQGGTGFAKAGGNYAATFLASREGREKGYAQILWLDGVDHKYIEEVGQMNICFLLNDRLVTPELRGTILPGVTRDSVLRIVSDMGIECDERLVEIDEIIEGVQLNTLQEAFGCGTAAVITAVGSIGYRESLHVINDGQSGELSRHLYHTIVGIQRGEIEDRYGWTQLIEV